MSLNGQFSGGGMNKAQMAWLAAQIAGEMRVEDVPLAPWADLTALKAGDTDPLEVVVEVPAGKSKRGWNYTPQALQKIVGEVMSQGLPGFLGHQKAENVDTEFPKPVTHWVGAKFENGKAYFRGVIDAAAGDLKRWIRAKTIRQVSIFGAPKLTTVSGETHVVDYRPLSIDWTPLGRAGMATAIVAMGEMDVIPASGNAGTGEETQPMTLQELLAELRKLGVKPNQVVGEMGWKPADILTDLGIKFEDLAAQIGGDAWKSATEAQAAIGEMATVLGLAQGAKSADVVAAVKTARQAQIAAAEAARTAMVDKVVGEMVVAEAARPLVKRLLQVPADADEAKVKQLVGELLEQPDVKAALASLFAGGAPAPNPVAGTSASGTTLGAVNNPPVAGLRTRRIGI